MSNQVEVNKDGIKIQGGRAAFGEFGDKFEALKSKFVGLKRSIEYIQDFLNVQGEKLWREELARIIELAVEKEATRLVNKKYQANLNDVDEAVYIPEFEPIDEHDFTFMGRLLTAILKSMNMGFYLDQMSTWYEMSGEQAWGLRFINFLHENLGTTFLQGFDRLCCYRLTSELRQFYRDYGLQIGGGNIAKELQAKYQTREQKALIETLIGLEKEIKGNFESLSLEHMKNYTALMKMITPAMFGTFLPRMQTIGKLQLLRRLVTKQIHFAAKVECSQYCNVLETLNSTVLHNLEEIKEGAINAYCDLGEELDETAMISDMNMTSNRLGLNAAQVQKKEREAEAKKQIKSMLQALA